MEVPKLAEWSALGNGRGRGLRSLDFAFLEVVHVDVNAICGMVSCGRGQSMAAKVPSPSIPVDIMVEGGGGARCRVGTEQAICSEAELVDGAWTQEGEGCSK